MSSDTENRLPSKSLIENLTARNRELTQTIEEAEVPKMVSMPYKRRQAEIDLIKQAAQFQPELYRQISNLATMEDLKDHIRKIANTQKEYMVKMTSNCTEECRKMTDQIQQLIEQDGKDREKFTSECSSALKAERDKLSEQMEEFRRRSRRLLIAVFITATALSALVSYLLYRVLV